MTAAERFVAAARGYAGVPFRHLGRSRAGVDCVGLLLLAAAEAGIETDDPGAYAAFTRGHGLSDWLAARFDRVMSLSDHRDADVLLFAGGATHLPCHMGLRATRDALPSVIHAHIGRGMVLEERLAWHLARELRAAYRMKEA